ncbi:MAG: primosomal protein N' [Clostridiales bacterium]|nr:primosomal protein N' [Clostridiales bacterium]
MSLVNIARVAVENVAYSFDKIYDYIIPDAYLSQAKIGSRVTVPFGLGNKTRLGVIFELDKIEPNNKIKSIIAVLDKVPLIDDEMIKMALWLKERTFCTLFEATKCLLPSGINLRLVQSYIVNNKADENEIASLSEEEKSVFDYLLSKKGYIEEEKIIKDLSLDSENKSIEKLLKKGLIAKNVDAMQKIGDASVKSARLCLEEDEIDKIFNSLTKKQKEVVEFLEDVSSASIKEICYYLGLTPAVVNALEKKGIIEFFDNEYYRTPNDNIEQSDNSEIKLTEEQENAFNKIISVEEGNGGVCLLYGVTGSGKTQVFLKVIDEMQKKNRGVIVMVPEISLTPQTINIFKSRYSDKVAVFHSGLSLGERMDEWKRVNNGEADIVIGTRSAIFAPLKNIGAIIVDEEQEHTYKSESSPRYQAKDVAKFRCAYHKGVVVFASATPSVESYSNALNGKYTLCTMKSRYGTATLPKVITVDMACEVAQGHTGSISRILLKELENNLNMGHQSILLMNRRGYNTFVACKSCASVVTCPNCSISLTYHHANNRLMCHYCGYSEPFSEECKQCGEKNIRYSGAGTQHIEQELKELLPQARILRMDADTTMAKYSHEEKLSKFALGEYDIMLGTQMVAKGLDFPNVTLVGIINADQQLYNDDFRSLEQTFSLLTQVVGRSGRGKFEGRAVIQTMTPENPIIKLAAKQDYDAFYKTEIQLRKALIYPPYCDICLVGFVGSSEALVKSSSIFFFQKLKDILKEKYTDQKIIVLGPMAPKISKLNNKYRYRLIIKCRNSKQFRDMISELLLEYNKNTQFKSVTAFVDINPETIF